MSRLLQEMIYYLLDCFFPAYKWAVPVSGYLDRGKKKKDMYNAWNLN